ncbi:hypothetical protein A9Q84_17450 [Halobacteriovorax marinus]|uniref:Solute-binding protein family 5 domain-containing protein n=1 Tax=Halobacteriovorax marinus TaxID=97084 RepID=A0A1Y5F324_9BACT|nr:hypothetical protein A9Q84_17450 [Halobacteriovorax marinus]
MTCVFANEDNDIGLQKDTSTEHLLKERVKNSHIKIFIPSLPYLAISHSINAALVRPANNLKGWEYDLAESHRKVSEKVYEFKLRKGIRFQDGTSFNADSVLSNMHYFKKKPFTFSEFYKIFDRVEKIDQYTVKFILKEPYALFMQDALWLQFYTKTYLKKFGWNGKPSCPNLAAPGPYGAGPFILKSGYIEGDRATAVAELVANPYYWDQRYPKVEKITVYTDLERFKATQMVIGTEGLLDISPIAFADEVDTVLSKYAKLYSSASTNSYAIHFNMINGNKALLDNTIRKVINDSIDKEMILNLSMLGEGRMSPTMASPNFVDIERALSMKKLNHLKKQRYNSDNTYLLKQLVLDYKKQAGLDTTTPLKLKLITQEQFVFLINDIKHYLEQVFIELEVEIVKSERLVFGPLLSTVANKNKKKWDLIIWSNFDWFKHLWSALFVYRIGDNWSTIDKDDVLLSYIDDIKWTDPLGDKYVPLIARILERVYDKNYMLSLPSPNIVFAVNKEVSFIPRMSAIIPLWEMQISSRHWSVRSEPNYPKNLLRPIEIKRFNFNK